MITVTKNMTKYSMKRSGDKPMEVLKEEMNYLKENQPHHPILKAKSCELIAVPNVSKIDEYIRDFIRSDQCLPNKVYMAIVQLGSKTLTSQAMELTGKCKVNENLVKGARKWETLYVTYEIAPQKRADGTTIDLPVQRGKHDTKGEAMAFAKQYAIDHDTEVYVELEKRLVGSKSRIADIKPMKRTNEKKQEVPDNKFAFFGRSE